MTGDRRTEDRRRAFILENTDLVAPPHVPDIRLHLASEAHELWQKTEVELDEIGLPPPFWAFAWAGGQGLARYILDNPEMVSGKRILDLATGSGLVAIAAAKAGAAEVIGNDIDPYCASAVSLNAKANGVNINFTANDMTLESPEAFTAYDVILAGDVFYDREMATAFEILLRRLAADGKAVIVGDPGRSYFPQSGLTMLADYQVPVSRVLEDGEVKRTRVWRVD